MLRVEDLTFRRRRGAPVLDGVNFSLAGGEVVSLLGPNGAGKTTLLRAILGFLRPQAGRVRIDGEDVARLSRRAAARLVAYVPQATQNTEPLKVRDLVLMGRTAHLGLLAMPGAEDRAMAFSALERLGVAHLAERPVTAISGGERQIVLIARALAQEARILLLDEPTASLDYGNQLKVLGAIRSAVADGHGVLCATHAPDHALFLGGKAALLKEARLIAFGPVQDVLTSQRMSDLYGAPVAVVAHGTGSHARKVLIPFPDHPVPPRDKPCDPSVC
ncbi:ABC transporter ATP-binding protein [Xanthobacter autotrophicus DSM 431]|uniref:ABC transporter ATP-binding protein n=1 Tax=Xanthobacter nonsaccharivorans TaxID=3119912 RepID=UPI003727E260